LDIREADQRFCFFSGKEENKTFDSQAIGYPRSGTTLLLLFWKRRKQDTLYSQAIGRWEAKYKLREAKARWAVGGFKVCKHVLKLSLQWAGI
jgi:hypothetical protein